MPTEAPEWAGGLVLDALNDAKAQGIDGLSISAIQEQVGVGADDLATTLNVLREQGSVVEEAPDEWRLPYEDERRDGAAEERTYDPADGEDEREHSQPMPTGERRQPREGTVETRLTAGMATQLDADALGQLVLAGIKDADGRPFVLRIDP